MSTRRLPALWSVRGIPPRPPRKAAVKKAHRHHRITRLLAVSLAAGALAAPAASARPAPLDLPPVPDTGELVVIEPEPAPIVQPVEQGFDWGSAAIGAGGAGALLLLVSVGGLTYRHRHPHDSVGIAH